MPKCSCLVRHCVTSWLGYMKSKAASPEIEMHTIIRHNVYLHRENNTRAYRVRHTYTVSSVMYHDTICDGEAGLTDWQGLVNKGNGEGVWQGQGLWLRAVHGLVLFIIHHYSFPCSSLHYVTLSHTHWPTLKLPDGQFISLHLLLLLLLLRSHLTA